MNQLDKSLNVLKRALKNDSRMIPSFIVNKSINHKECMAISQYVFSDLDKLLVNKTLTTSKITEISLSIDIYFGEMVNINQEVSILYYSYFQDMMDYYIEYCQEEELWEVAANIKNFYEEFFKQKMLNKNE